MSLGLEKLIKEARDNGFNQQVNQALYNYLGSLGVTGALNDRLHKYLVSRHGEGSLSDLLYKEGVGYQFQRYFTKFLQNNTQYIQIPEVTLPTNTQWKITVEAAVPAQGAYLLADRLSNDSESRFGLLRDGRTFGLSDDSNSIGGDTKGLLSSTQLRTIEAVNNGGTIEILMDGTRVNIFNDGTLSPVLNSIGRQYNGETGVPTMLGYIARVVIEKAGVAVMDLVIDDDYTPSNNTVVDVSGNNNHGTFIGIADGDSQLFTKEEDSWVSDSTTLGAIS